MTVKRAERKAELPFAAIPLIFGVQQILEGIIWLTFRFDTPLLNTVMTNAYSLFSHVLWPIYVPFTVLALEPVPWRRKALYAFLAIGTAAGLYLLINMVRFPITSQLAGAHIEYVSPHFYAFVVMGSYLAGTCLSALLSQPQNREPLWSRCRAAVRRCVPHLYLVVYLRMVLLRSRIKCGRLFALPHSRASPGIGMSFDWFAGARLESQPPYRRIGS